MRRPPAAGSGPGSSALGPGSRRRRRRRRRRRHSSSSSSSSCLHRRCRPRRPRPRRSPRSRSPPDGQTRWNRRLFRSGPMAHSTPLLEVPSPVGPPCAPRGGTRAELGHWQAGPFDQAGAPHHRRPLRRRPHWACLSAASACRAGAPAWPWPQRQSPLALVRPTARFPPHRPVAEASECLADLGVGSRRIGDFGQGSGPHWLSSIHQLGPGWLSCPSREHAVAWSRESQPREVRLASRGWHHQDGTFNMLAERRLCVVGRSSGLDGSNAASAAPSVAAASVPGDDTLPPAARASGDDPSASVLAPSASSAFWFGWLSPPPPPLFFFFFLFLFFFLAPSASSGECTGSGSGSAIGRPPTRGQGWGGLPAELTVRNESPYAASQTSQPVADLATRETEAMGG